MSRAWTISLLAALIGGAAPAAAQLIGGGLSGALGGVTAPVGGLLGQAQLQGAATATAALASPLDIAVFRGALSPGDLLALRRERLRALVRANRNVLDADDVGAPIRRDEIVAINVTPAVLDRIQTAGFAAIRQETIDGVGLALTILKPPRHKSARKAIALLRATDPDGAYELNHIYQPAGGSLGPGDGAAAGSGRSGGIKVGLIDGGIGAHPAFAAAHIEQRGFAGAVQPSGHGTAVASLLVGDAGAFHGAATGTMLYAADVYGGSPAAGSAEAIAQAMGWLATRGVRVVNISLVGPPNRLLEASVAALIRRGIIIVASVGNDGPAAPPQFPAAYPNVMAVTATDPRGRVLAEAGGAAHLDFAAPGSELAGAVPGGRYETLRGTSFAAPFVTARLAHAMQGGAAQPVDAVAAEATPGRDVGRGIVCVSCRIAPRAVGVR